MRGGSTHVVELELATGEEWWQLSARLGPLPEVAERPSDRQGQRKGSESWGNFRVADQPTVAPNVNLSILTKGTTKDASRISGSTTAAPASDKL